MRLDRVRAKRPCNLPKPVLEQLIDGDRRIALSEIGEPPGVVAVRRQLQPARMQLSDFFFQRHPSQQVGDALGNRGRRIAVARR
jgi:hypothetical protein